MLNVLAKFGVKDQWEMGVKRSVRRIYRLLHRHGCSRSGAVHCPCFPCNGFGAALDPTSVRW